MTIKLPEINIDLHPKQSTAFLSKATEIMYGGAAGGGKSHLMRSAAITWSAEIAGIQIYLFRRNSKELMKNHMEGPKGFRNMLSPWTKHGFSEIVKDEIRFWNGSKIFLCHCQLEKHKYNFDGPELHVLMIDELTHFTESIYRFLRGRVRAVGLPELPEKYKGCFPRIVSGTNPGNIGHLWVKASFIDNCLPFEIRQMEPEEGGMLRQYIPALLNDNPSMTKDDPTYENKLRGLGSKALVDAKLKGLWDIIEGAFFDNWSPELVIDPFIVPVDWARFGSFDWGSAKPFCYGWYAVSPGYQVPDGPYIQKGAIVKYREWYGCVKVDGKIKPDTGLKLDVEQVADGILKRNNKEKLNYSVADPAIFTKDGGRSMAQRFALKKLYFRRADNSRVAGWDQVRSRITGIDKKPMLYIFKTCYDSVRTIPALQHDETKPEDLNTKMEDHAADETRYACMSNIFVAPIHPKKKDTPKDGYHVDDQGNNWRLA